LIYKPLLEPFKAIRGPKILQDAWDNTKTVRQNYAALGLVHTLNPSASGGVEPLESQSHQSRHIQAVPQTSLPLSSSEITHIPKGFGKIIRDEEGNVLRVEMAEELEKDSASAVEEDMETLTPEVDSGLMEKWVTEMGDGNAQGKISSVGVVEALERISSVMHHGSTTLSIPMSSAGPRHSSAGEVTYLKRLVGKYGDDLEKMSKDRKLNPEQHTVGGLRRALRRAGLGGGRRS